MRVPIAVLALLLAAPNLAAQESNPFALEPGDIIRLRAPLPGDAMAAAMVQSVGPVYFNFSLEDDPEARVLTRAFSSVDTLDIRERSRRYSARSGAIWGAYLGAALGAIGGPFAAPRLEMETGASVAMFAGGGGAVGALTGAAIGALIAPARWYRYVRRR